MAKKVNETRTSIEELNESLSGIEKKVEDNKKMIVWVVAAIIAIAAIILGYIQESLHTFTTHYVQSATH